MLRITVGKKPGRVTAGLIVEGRLEGPCVSELRAVWHSVFVNANSSVEVDLNGVTYASQSGAELLRTLRLQGATFATNSTLGDSWIQDQIADATERITT